MLVNRAGVNYQIAASDLDLGPDGLIVPSVDVLTPVNGAGLDEGTAYTPVSSAYVSTDSTPIYYRWFPELITTVSGGPWVNENNLFDGSGAIHAELTGAAYAVSQFVFTPHPGWTDGETDCYVYGTAGGTIEILDDADTVLRTYSYLSSPGDYAVGIVRSDQKIRFTSNGVNESIYVAAIGGLDGGAVDYVISGRVAFEFTDDTDLDKMVAPIIQVDETGNVKVPTTSTVDSTTTIPGENKGLQQVWVGDGVITQGWINSDSYPVDQRPPGGARMVWAKTDMTAEPIITDNVTPDLIGNHLETSNANSISLGGPDLQENQSQYAPNNKWNANNAYSYIAEIGVAPKVLDIVNWTGDGNPVRAIPHNLGVKPGMIVVRRVNASGQWSVWHKDLTPGENLYFNTTQGESNGGIFPNEPTKDVFYVTSSPNSNLNSDRYVAYVFAGDTPGQIKCGEYTGTNSDQVIDCGFRAGFFLIKKRNGGTNWCLGTNKTTDQGDKWWNPNSSGALRHGTQTNRISSSLYGFSVFGGDVDYNSANSPYIYLAINIDLAGPNSTQLNLLGGQDLEYFYDGLEITSNAAAGGSRISFDSNYYGGNGMPGSTVIPVVDGNQDWFDPTPNGGNKWLLWIKSSDSTYDHTWFDSERNNNSFISSHSMAGQQYSPSIYITPYSAYGQSGWQLGTDVSINGGSINYQAWSFLGSREFFDVQKYTGNGNTQTIQHDLGVEPGFIMVKNLSGSYDWQCYHHALGFDQNLELNSTGGSIVRPNRVIATTDQDFTVGHVSPVNSDSTMYISYIFAKDTPYVKCGTYTGAGTNMYVDVGFQPRWMMVKRTDSNGSWFILDVDSITNTYLLADQVSSRGNFVWYFDTTGVTFAELHPDVNDVGAGYVYIAIAQGVHPPEFPSSSTVQGTPDVNAATMVVNAESFDVGDSASAAPLDATITSVAGAEGNTLLVDGSTGTWMPGLYAKGSETTASAPSADEIVFTSSNAGTTAFSGVDATLSSRTWTLESGPAATGPWTVVDTYVDYDALASQDGATPWSSNKPALAADTFYRVKVQYDSTNAESVESVYSTFKTSA